MNVSAPERKNLRLLGFTNFYPPLARGGYGEICADVMAGLAARGHDVTVLAHAGESGRGVRVRAELDYVLAAWRHPARGLRAAANDRRVAESALAGGVDAALVWHMRGLAKAPLRLLHEAEEDQRTDPSGNAERSTMSSSTAPGRAANRLQ